MKMTSSQNITHTPKSKATPAMPQKKRPNLDKDISKVEEDGDLLS